MDVGEVVPGAWRLEFAVGLAHLCRTGRGLTLIDAGSAGEGLMRKICTRS
ncbi:MAG: hypothetical protein ACRDU0_08530 [Mycobacterium sp.]